METGPGGGGLEHAVAPLLPEGFRFGVATAGFQIEGGYNGPGEPANNWHRWEADGRVEPSGSAIGFWDRYEEHLDLVAGLGCDSFRMSIEWARTEPEDGTVDEAAIDRYRRILEACRTRRLEPLVTLHHFTHPEWLGEEFWLHPDAPDRFASWVRVAVEAFGDLCTNWITSNELNVLALESFVTGTFPPGGFGRLRTAVTALDHLVTGHVLAYDVIHDRQPESTVSTNNYSLSIYEFDRLPLDLLVARHHGIARSDLATWLGSRRRDHARATPRPRGLHGAPEAALRSLATHSLPLDRGLPRATEAVYASRHDCHLDVAQVDFYAPGAAEHVVWPGHRTAGGRSFNPARDLWDDPPDPARLTRTLQEVTVFDRDVWLVENGMCNRVRNGRSHPRLDGWTRDRYLREHLAAVVTAVEQGVPVTGYWHWTLADNYEWGSYQPRFGLYGVDRERGLVIDDRDAMGVDAAGAYRRLITELRNGDRSVLVP
ncbi:MAG: family 1 glycosylhydrolase [Acidimicrobiales bacterium]